MDPDNNLELDFQELLKKTVKIVKLRKKLGGIIKSDKNNSQVSNLVDRCDKKAFLSSPPNSFVLFPTSTFKPLIIVLSSDFVARSEDKNVKQLTEMMQSLAFLVRTLQLHLGQALIGVGQPALSNQTFQIASNPRNCSISLTFLVGVDKYLYYWFQAHFLKRNCPAFQKDLNSNRIH